MKATLFKVFAVIGVIAVAMYAYLKISKKGFLADEEGKPVFGTPDKAK